MLNGFWFLELMLSQLLPLDLPVVRINFSLMKLEIAEIPLDWDGYMISTFFPQSGNGHTSDLVTKSFFSM
jgi:hypothetical protein